MLPSRMPLLVALLLTALPTIGIAQDDTGADEPVITERMAYPYSIDLLPDDPAPAPFAEAPDSPGPRPGTGGRSDPKR